MQKCYREMSEIALPIVLLLCIGSFLLHYFKFRKDSIERVYERISKQRKKIIKNKSYIISPILEHICISLKLNNRDDNYNSIDEHDEYILKEENLSKIEPSLLCLSISGGVLDAENSIDIVLRLFQYAINNYNNKQDYIFETQIKQKTIVEIPRKTPYGTIQSSIEYYSIHPYTLNYIKCNPIMEKDLIYFQNISCLLLLHFPLLSIRYLLWIFEDLHIVPDTEYLIKNYTSDVFRTTKIGSYVEIASI